MAIELTQAHAPIQIANYNQSQIDLNVIQPPRTQHSGTASH
jgi:hypothetical protein